MSERARSSEWLSLRRSLAILGRLLRGPATGEELIGAVMQAAGADAYPASDSARQKAFKRDRGHLREHLGVDFHYYISPTYEDRQPRYFEVAPHKIVYQWGHWYLRAHNLLHRPVAGVIER